MKKGEPAADHIIRFLGGYTKFINEKGTSCIPISKKFGLNELAAEGKDAEEDEDEDGDITDTTASRFTAKILNWLMSGFMTKDKNVRYRVLQTVAEMVSHLGEIEYVCRL